MFPCAQRFEWWGRGPGNLPVGGRTSAPGLEFQGYTLASECAPNRTPTLPRLPSGLPFHSHPSKPHVGREPTLRSKFAEVPRREVAGSDGPPHERVAFPLGSSTCSPSGVAHDWVGWFRASSPVNISHARPPVAANARPLVTAGWSRYQVTSPDKFPRWWNRSLACPGMATFCPEGGPGWVLCPLPPNGSWRRPGETRGLTRQARPEPRVG